MALLGRHATGPILAMSTVMATVFVAVQAWYARIEIVQESETQLLEKQLDICFENFDQAVALDRALRDAVPGPGIDDVWPPLIEVGSAARLEAVKRQVVPKLDAFQAGLIKASILGDLDKHRTYLAQTLEGLSKRIMDVSPTRLGAEGDAAHAALWRDLSEFLGVQYPVFTGCRMTAEGDRE